MRFIGLRLDNHDSSISYFDGEKVRYYKSERDIQEKHHCWDDLTSWFEVWQRYGHKAFDVTAIAIVLDVEEAEHPEIECDTSKLWEEIEIAEFREMGFKCPIFRVDHHYAHTLSCWTTGADFDVNVVVDCYGNNQNSHTIMRGEEVVSQHSLQYTPGITKYASFGTMLCEVGFAMGLNSNPLDHAGKVMALKGFGSSTDHKITHNLSNLVDLWDFMFVEDCEDQQEIYDHIHRCHTITENIYINWIKENTTEDQVIGYAGGVAQNTILNTCFKRLRPNLHIPAHINDEGLSLGAIEFLRRINNKDPFPIEGYPFWQQDYAPERPSTAMIKMAADQLAQGKIVGWYQGHGEVGPRALGNRSILMNPTIQDGKDTLNAKVKHREWFRPFGASVLEHAVSDYFDWEGTSPYMLYVMEVLDKKSFPAITHVDGTCRPQTVSPDHEVYYELISEFEKLTGIPMLLNTSLNNNGKPIAGVPQDAMDLFNNSEMDTLIVGNKVMGSR